jgi:DNA replication and repair protein RecF
MHIKHLSLSNFRNYSTLELPLQPGVNLLVGRNGQGKTNLVEAIFYAATLNSHRVSGYLPLVKHQQDKAVVRILAGFEDRENLIEIELNVSGSNRARINRSDTPRVRDVLGLVSAVIFSPEDLDIVKRDPSNRRAFIDDLLVQLTPRLAGVFSDYDRVLKQRNTLLKTSRNLPKDSPGLDTLAAWDDSLIKLGTEIIAFRQDLIKRMAAPLLSSYAAIADEKNNPSIKYKSSLTGSNIVEPEVFVEDFLVTSDREELETKFRTKLELVKTKELERGISLVGPHRDDLVLYLGDYPAKGFVSHGESWSYALALKLASAKLLREEARAGDPILILDDVFAELDSTRRTRLANLVSDNEQVLITAAVVEDVPTELSANRIFVTAGEITVGNE